MLTTQQRYALEKDGHVFIPEFLPDIDIVSCGKIIGEIVTPHLLLNGLTADIVNKLTPRHKIKSKNNTYSTIFGLDEFPYHTDLAHYTLPPNYLMLRCIEGANDVKTMIISSGDIMEKYDKIKLKKCIFKPRDKLSIMSSFPLPLIFDNGFLRWDSVFLHPVNKFAEEFHNWMSLTKWHDIEKSYSLSNKGDCLIINNRTSLHSRSSVPEKDKSRVVERIYLSEIWK